MANLKKEHFDNDQTFAEGDTYTPESFRRQRTQVIYSEGYNPNNDKGIEDTFHVKTDSQREKLMDAVNECLLFRSLDEDHRDMVINAMFERIVKENEFVTQQGEDGDNFYIVYEGAFDVYIDGKYISTYNNSGCFGELALMYNMPRAASVKAKTDGLLFALDRQTFRRIVLRGAFRKRKLYENLIENVPILQELKSFEKMNLADALEPRSYRKGDVIIKQGEPADGMYFLESGIVDACFVSDDADKNKVIKQIDRGGYFGELALVTKKPRALTIIAASDVKCAFLDVEAFERLLGPCMEIMKRNIETYEEQSSEIFGKKG